MSRLSESYGEKAIIRKAIIREDGAPRCVAMPATFQHWPEPYLRLTLLRGLVARPTRTPFAEFHGVGISGSIRRRGELWGKEDDEL